MEHKLLPSRRFQHYLLIVIDTILLSCFFMFDKKFILDMVLAYLIVDAFFLAVLLYILENNRLHDKLGNSNSSHYGEIAFCYSIFCAICLGCYFLPAYTCPVAAFALFLALVANLEISISCCSFLGVLLCMASEGSLYELAAYLLLVLFGAQMSKTMREKSQRLWGCILLVSISLGIPIIFHYLAYQQSSLRMFLWNCVFGILTVLLYHLIAERLYSKTDYEEIDSAEIILNAKYPLVVDIKNYSKAEYVHAMKMATIARKCAAEIGANAMVAAAAGFYYRLGILEGEPIVENGVRLAEENCFPKAVIQILSEYNGEQKLPSTRESAIVHMADACLKRIELITGHNLSTSWNQDMVIYQTLNEVSATGIYDESGLSMNQFLKVRELLVREEIGYDNYD